jgi:hypothetical protein
VESISAENGDKFALTFVQIQHHYLKNVFWCKYGVNLVHFMVEYQTYFTKKDKYIFFRFEMMKEILNEELSGLYFCSIFRRKFNIN